MRTFLLRRWRWLTAATVLAALGLALLALRPFLATYTIPVVAKFQAPDASEAVLAWGDGPDEHVLLVPENPAPTEAERDGVRAWVGLLPPVPIDHLRLTVPAPKDFHFVELRLDTRTPWHYYTLLTAEDLTESGPPDEADRTLVMSKSLGLNAPPGRSRLPQFWFVPGLLLAVSVLCGIRCLGAASTVVSRRTAQGCRWMTRTCLLITAVYVLHSQTMPALFDGGDSHCFLWKGARLAERFYYDDPGNYEYELCKLPGYAVVYALVVKLVGYHISALILLQHLIFCWCLYLLGRACLHYAPPIAVCIGLLVLAASPVQFYCCILLLSESLTVSCLLGAFACLLELGVEGGMSWGRLLKFAGWVGAASLMRSNAVLLGLGLVPLCVHLARQRRLSWSAVGLRGVVATVVLLLPLAGWSVRNYYARQVLEPQHMKGIILFQGLCVGGTIEPRAPALQPHYAALSRLAANVGYSPWELRSKMYLQGIQEGLSGQLIMQQVEHTLLAVVEQSSRANPSLHAAAMLRAFYENVCQPPTVNHTGEARNIPFSNGYPPEAARRQYVEAVKASSPHTAYDLRTGKGWLAELFALWNGAYLVYYRVVLAAALAAAALLAWRRAHPLLFVPIVFFTLNALVYAALVMPYGRYVLVFDVFLVLQVVFLFASGQESPTPTKV